ncbi:MAG: adenosylcobinamide amidohydrolase [Zoogloeaceae bacterium]|jgi:adenosylcobinamide amidohydrolase|nr:adenosylcobinamide amidohydrolase [Zoogloeaceae bacterium]
MRHHMKICFSVILFGVSAALYTAETPIESLPESLRVNAKIIENERDGLWEKSLVVTFPETRKTLSTTEGFGHARAAINHAAHPFLWEQVSKTFLGKDGNGGKRYIAHIHEQIARALKLDRSTLATMGTAADMDNLAVVTRKYGPFVVTALVTAGAKTNAIRTGVDEGTHIETPHGTINILLLTNARLTEGAMARAIVTLTEAKTAALEDLKVPSSYTKTAQATGTGTDSVIVVSGVSGPEVSYTGGHSRIGELIGKAAYHAVIEALGKQNGFLLPGAPPFVTPNRLREQEVVAAAEQWLTVVDAGDAPSILEAWGAASALLHQTEDRKVWSDALESAYSGLGKNTARKMSRNLHTRALPGLPVDEYMLVEFESHFENQSNIIETITCRKDGDGVWRVLRYSLKRQDENGKTT